MKKFIASTLALSSALGVSACRPVGSMAPSSSVSADDTSSSASAASSFTASPAEVFGLASYVKSSSALEKFHPYVGPGDSYLFFGEKDKFRVETNLSVEARGGSALVFGGDRFIRTAYFLDAYAFGRPLANGDAVDIEAKADLNSMKLALSVRALGNTLYEHEVTSGYEQKFVRDFEYKDAASAVSLGVPIPGLGVTITGKIGGEIGLKAAPGLRGDGAISAAFEPNVALNGSIAGGLTAFNFASVEAKGSAMIMDFRVSGGANLGYSPFNQFVYGDAGFDGGTINALDGKVELLAKADLGGALPEGVSPILWNLIGSTPESKAFQHTLWDPEIVYASQIPGNGASFIKYVAAPKDCETTVTNTLVNMKGRLAKMNEQKQNFVGQEAIVLASSIASMDRVISQLEGYCEKVLATGDTTSADHLPHN